MLKAPGSKRADWHRLKRLFSLWRRCRTGWPGNLPTDPAKRATFRRVAAQFRKIAVDLKIQMDGGSLTVGSDEYFRLQAHRCRELAAFTSDERIASELLRLSEEFEVKAAAKSSAGSRCALCAGTACGCPELAARSPFLRPRRHSRS